MSKKRARKRTDPLHDSEVDLASPYAAACFAVSSGCSMTMSESPRRSRSIEPALCEWGAPVDPASPWACVLLGIRHAATPGEIVLGDDGVERAWVGGKSVPLGTYRREAERAVRELASQYPKGALARDLAALDAARRRARMTRTLLRSSSGRTSARLGSPGRARARRPVRRARLTRRLRRRGTDPPDPSGEEPPRSASAPVVVYIAGPASRATSRRRARPRSRRRRWPV